MANKKTAQEVVHIPISEVSGGFTPPAPGEAITLDLDGDGESGNLPGVSLNSDEDGEITFSINAIPGAPEDIVLDDDEPEAEMEAAPEEEVSDGPIDVWNWEKSHGVKNFIKWLQQMVQGVPKHSGSDTTGVERAIAYFDRVNSEISKAMRRDFNREIDAAKAEEARSTIESGVERLIDRLEKLRVKKFKKGKKKADFTHDGIIKNAETSFTGSITVNVPYFISFISRVCIESTVQGGKDMHEIFVKLASEYKLDKREKVQVIQLIKDMGYPLVLDRVRLNEGTLEMKDLDGEFMAQYQA